MWLIYCSCRVALNNTLLDPIEGLNTTNATAPLQQGLGLRQYYEFGLYSYCGYINSTAGTCGNHTAAAPFNPFQAIIGDLASNYSIITSVLLSNTTLADTKYLGQSSSAAYYLILLGTILTAVTFLTYVWRLDFWVARLTLAEVLRSVALPSLYLDYFPLWAQFCCSLPPAFGLFWWTNQSLWILWPLDPISCRLIS